MRKPPPFVRPGAAFIASRTATQPASATHSARSSASMASSSTPSASSSLLPRHQARRVRGRCGPAGSRIFAWASAFTYCHGSVAALRPAPPSAGGLPMGSEICLDLLDARPDLLAGLLAGPSGEAFHVAGLPDPRQAAPSCRCPLPPQHQHRAQLAAGSRQHTPGRAVPDWMASLWRSCDFGSFVLGPAGDRPRERSRRPGSPELRLPASRNSANQPGRHALSARAAMTPCPAGAQVLCRAIPPRRDCGYRSVAGRRNSTGRTSSPQRCMSAGPSGTPVRFGA